MKTCSSCHQSFDLSMFQLDRSKPDGRRYQCKFCRARNRKAYLSASGRTNIKKAVSDYRANAKRRGYSWQLTTDEAIALLGQACFYCGASPQSNGKNGIKKNGIDRKNNEMGYLPENCVPCCWRCNYLKGDSSYDEFVTLIKLIYGRVVNESQTNQTSSERGQRGC